jgi:predicted anti-sigma-YlaC factor YlaD
VDCRETLKELADFLDEQEQAEICRAIAEHLSLCPTCRYYVDSVKKTIVLYQSDAVTPIPVTVSSQLQAKLAQEYRASSD